MRHLDAAKAYLAVTRNGWGRQDAVKAASMVFSSGGFGGLMSAGRGEYWPNTFHSLTDPWPVRAGLTGLAAACANSTAQACISWIQRTAIEPRPWVTDGLGQDAEEIEGHPVTRLLQRPNPHFTPERMWQITLADLWLPDRGNGNAYWEKIPDRTGKPAELWHIPATEMEPQWPQDGSEFISHYERRVNGKTLPPIDPKRIIHFRFGQDPANQRKGWSPVSAGASELGILNEGAAYRQSILGNHGVPSYALTPRDEAVARSMDPEKQSLLSKLFQSKFGGGNRASGLFIPNFVADLTRVGFSPQELDIRELLEWDAQTVCALFGLNSMILGLPSGNGERTYANQADAREAAFRSNIIPSQRVIAADLELQLLRDFDQDPSHHVGWDYSSVGVLQEDQNALFERYASAWSKGMITREQAKQGVGLSVEDGVDRVYLIPVAGTLTSADETPEDREQKQMEREEQQQALPPPPESSGDAAVNGNGNGRALEGVAAKALPLPTTVTLTRKDVAAAEAAFAESVGVEFRDILEAEEA